MQILIHGHTDHFSNIFSYACIFAWLLLIYISISAFQPQLAISTTVEPFLLTTLWLCSAVCVYGRHIQMTFDAAVWYGGNLDPI